MLYLTFALYIIASVASQFLTTTPVELFTLFGVAIWMPLSALTIVPLVDVLRSFTQHYMEIAKWTFKRTFFTSLIVSTVLSGLCVLFANLPLPIFTGVLLACTLGGAVDILVFRKVGEFFKSPAVRMIFSNGAATLVGSGIVLFTAFTDLVFTNNTMARPLFDVTVGWLTQSLFIWVCSVIIGMTLQPILAKKK